MGIIADLQPEDLLIKSDQGDLNFDIVCFVLRESGVTPMLSAPATHYEPYWQVLRVIFKHSRAAGCWIPVSKKTLDGSWTPWNPDPTYERREAQKKMVFFGLLERVGNKVKISQKFIELYVGKLDKNTAEK